MSRESQPGRWPPGRPMMPGVAPRFGQNESVRISVDRLKCESNGLCVGHAPDIFEIDDNDELVILNEEPSADRRVAVQTAVRMCPKQALSLLD